MHTPNRVAAASVRALRLMPILAALLQPLTCIASDGMPAGYAPLVRRVAPSVVTVIVEEQSIGATRRTRGA